MAAASSSQQSFVGGWDSPSSTLLFSGLGIRGRNAVRQTPPDRGGREIVVIMIPVAPLSILGDAGIRRRFRPL